MKHWMFNCSQVSERVSISLDIPQPFLQRMMIRVHLMMCHHCKRFRQQLLRVRRLCRWTGHHESGLETPRSLSRQARQKIKTALRDAWPHPRPNPMP